MEQIDWSKAPHWADRVVLSPRYRHLFWADDNSRQYFVIGQRRQDNLHVRDNWEVVERRPAHFTARPPETFMCRCVAAPVSRTIEQRIASLRALEKQVEETRAELTRDLESLGLTWMVQDEPEQPTITNWRDLRVGDVIIIDYVNGDHIGEDRKLALEGRESFIVSDCDSYPICVTNDYYPKGRSLNMECAVKNGCRWRFIRRP